MTRARPLEPLTELEQDVLEWLARGHTFARVGRLTGLSESGVHGVQARVIVKLDAQNLVHAVHRAHCLGLLENPGHSRGQRKRQSERQGRTKISGGDRVQSYDGDGSAHL